MRRPAPSRPPKPAPARPKGAGRADSLASLARPVTKDSVVSLVVARIRDALLRKDLKPGDYLPSELELTRSLGVGKSSIREAVKMLQAMGVVEVRRGQGTVIQSRPGADCISPLLFQLITEHGYPEDLIELRMMFEPAYTVMAMERATDEDRGRVRRALERLEAAVRAGRQVADDDLAFHAAILEATHNPLVIRIGETILQLFTPSIGISMRHIADRAVRDHRRIYEAFCAGEAGRLRGAVMESYDGWRQSLYREPEGGKVRAERPRPGRRTDRGSAV